MKFSLLLCCAFFATFFFSPVSIESQEQRLTQEDYARAEQFLQWNAVKLTRNLDIAPHWIEKSDRFWFRYQMPNGKEFLLVDSDRNLSQPAFDRTRFAAALSSAAGKSYSAANLPFDAFEFAQNDQVIEFEVEKSRWSCDLKSYECQKSGPSPSTSGVLSPDKHWAAFVKDHNLYVRSLVSKQEFQLTEDGRQYDDYAVEPDSDTSAITRRITMGATQPIEVVWSPDSKKLISYKLDQTRVKESYLIQSVPPGPTGAARPVLYSYRYPFPGDKDVAMLKYFIFDVQSKARIALDVPPQAISYVTAFGFHWVWWNKDGNRVYCIQNDRWCKTMTLSVADASTGSTRTIIEDRGDTYVEAGPQIGDSLIHVLENSAEIIWFSQRDGWGHLCLYDARTGRLKNQITSGPWLVRSIDHVDEANGWVYLSASGREKGEDPYLRHLYRIKLDGSSLQLLTPENADHTINFSPSGRYFVDVYSRVDTVPMSVLRSADGKVVRELATGDIAGLVAKGWRSPKPFQAKAADGVTDIYGVIYLPPNLDPSKKYAVLDSIYGGPQEVRTPKSFSGLAGFTSCLDSVGGAPSLAQLGFVVVTVDGRGTPLRSKAFRDYSYGKLGDAGGLEDHVAAIKQLATRLPYLDLSRVGIYGHSGGGFATVRAMLVYPDFYKVGVASSGNQDQRGYIAYWGEKYQGPLETTDYQEASNPMLALTANLKGKLLIAWGDMDDNVPPPVQMQLIHSLIKANRDFDMLVLPNRNHSIRRDPYFIRRRWDYLVKNLLGKEPPQGYEIKTAAPGYRTLDAPEKERK
jgi:dipeptidyl-peptidase 4